MVVAERVGFVPDEPAPFNGLGRIGNRQILWKPEYQVQTRDSAITPFLVSNAFNRPNLAGPHPRWTFFTQQHGSATRSHVERAGRTIREQWAS
jgi:hypothetical protein